MQSLYNFSAMMAFSTEMKIREEWLKENFGEGEMNRYYDTHFITEFELYSMYKNGLISPQNNFTTWKGIIQNSTFDNRMFDSTSANFKDIKEDLEIAMNFLIMNQNITYIEAKDSKVILKRTGDCQERD